MNSMMRFAALFALSLAASAGQAATYRWVDEHGQVHYSDTLPNQASGMGNVELDKQGRVKKENPRTRLSPEEQRRLEEERVRLEDAKRQEEIQHRRDRSLLTTYVSEAEIDLTRDRALEQEISNLNGLKARIKSANEKLAYANNQLNQAGRGGNNEARTFTQIREEARSELAQLEKLVQQREQAMEEIKARYESDKLRFRELRAAPAR